MILSDLFCYLRGSIYLCRWTIVSLYKCYKRTSSYKNIYGISSRRAECSEVFHDISMRCGAWVGR